MNQVHESHQINLFTTNEEISPSPAIIFPVLQELSGFSLIPTFGQEVNALSGEMKQILIMTNPEQTYRIEFASHAIVINAMSTNHDEFVEKSVNVISAMLKIFPNKKFNRIALLNAQILLLLWININSCMINYSHTMKFLLLSGITELRFVKILNLIMRQ